MVIARATGWAKGGWQAIRRLEPRILLALLVAIVGVWTFVAIADELLEEDLVDLDQGVASFFRHPDGVPKGPLELRAAARDVTALGSVTVLCAAVVFVCVGLAVARRSRQAAFVGGAAVTGLAVAYALKAVFDRARPATQAALEHATPSFPSGHAFNSAVIYLTLGALVSRFTDRRSLRVYVFGTSLGLTAAIGVTRVYLGYHYASDVLAGWAGGLAWALVCVLVAEWLTRKVGTRGKLDPPKPAA